MRPDPRMCSVHFMLVESDKDFAAVVRWMYEKF